MGREKGDGLRDGSLGRRRDFVKGGGDGEGGKRLCQLGCWENDDRVLEEDRVRVNLDYFKFSCGKKKYNAWDPESFVFED